MTEPDTVALPPAMARPAALRAGAGGGRLGLSAVLLGLTAVLATTVILAVACGPVFIPFGEVWLIIARKLGLLLTGHDGTAAPDGHEIIVLSIRLPRVILGGIVGAGLAVVGATLQAATRNPLADPYLFGISSGACLGAVIVLLYSGAIFGTASLSIAAFLGSAFSMALVVAVAQKRGGLSSDRLILAGLSVSFVVMAGGQIGNVARLRAARCLCARGDVLSAGTGYLDYRR
jgi:iron complex transport system permease protein